MSAAAADEPASTVTPLTTLMITEVPGFLSATGTWTIPDPPTPGDRIAEPINSVRIWCDRSTRHCYEAIATLQNGADRKAVNKHLLADLVDFDITSWSKQEVTAETAALCVTVSLSINLVRKEVFKISRNGGTSPNGCKGMTGWRPMDKPVVAKLVSGPEALQADPRTR